MAKVNLNGSYSDIFGKRGREWIRHQSLTEAKQIMVNLYLKRFEEIQQAITEIEAITENRKLTIIIYHILKEKRPYIKSSNGRLP